MVLLLCLFISRLIINFQRNIILHVLNPIFEGNWTQEMIGHAERVYQADRMRQQLGAQLVNLGLNALHDFSAEVAVDHEPACVLVHSPERVERRQFVHHLAKSDILVELV
jgi:hypothetical protein